MAAFTIMTQNLGHNGKPKWADVACLQEADRDIVAEALPNHRIWQEGGNIIAYDHLVVHNVRKRRYLFHKGIRGISPTRYLMELRCKVNGKRITILNAHMINAAWAPVGRRTSNWKFRRGWWKEESRLIRRRIFLNRCLGRQVITCGDLNRLGDTFQYSKFEIVIGRQRLDRMFYTEGPFFATFKELLEKVGTGRVTHNGLRVVFDLKKP